ncbi:MAG: D-aminoacyl-tRNA deacylase [Patescibacteria group bacterium]|nr:D-tyrosyl-tRNA(Tyr) deacylase [Patescibacteria group bacterium]
MKALIQRVKKSSVTAGDEVVGKIGKGLLILLGVTHEDTEKNIAPLVEKIVNLRIFEDGEKHFEKSLMEIQGETLVVSQFTLYGSTKKGRRPEFTKAAKPEHAEELYEKFVEEFRKTGLKVETGKFREMMDVSLVNDGPVTLMIES